MENFRRNTEKVGFSAPAKRNLLDIGANSGSYDDDPFAE